MNWFTMPVHRRKIYSDITDRRVSPLSSRDDIDSIESAIHGANDGRGMERTKAVITTPQDGRYTMAALAAMDHPCILSLKTVV